MRIIDSICRKLTCCAAAALVAGCAASQPSANLPRATVDATVPELNVVWIGFGP